METLAIDKFINGINNIDSSINTPTGYLREAYNVDIDNLGSVKTRRGFTKIYTGYNIHSYYKGYFVENTDLKYLDTKDNSVSLVYPNFGKSEVSYTYVNSVLLASNGSNIVKLFRSTYEELSITALSTTPKVSTSQGNLAAGQYQLAFAVVNQYGEMSVPTDIIQVNISDGQSIAINNIPTIPVNHRLRVYCSLSNGTVLYKQGDYISTGNININSVQDNTHTLTEDKLINLPPGDILAYGKGRLFSAKDNTIWFSEPMWYGITKATSNFFTFPEEITIMLSIDTGLFVVSDATYFISLIDINSITLKRISEIKAIPGTGLIANGSDFGEDSETKLAYWMSEDGPVVGTTDGSIMNLTKQKVVVPTSTKGTTTYTEHDGMRQIITSMQKANEDINQIGAGDNASIQIIRNGVKV